MFSVVVTDNDNETVKSDKYTVEYKDASGKAVDEFSDAGEYTIEIKSSDYELTGTTVVKVTINKLDLTDLVLNEEGKFNYVYLNVRTPTLSSTARRSSTPRASTPMTTESSTTSPPSPPAAT